MSQKEKIFQELDNILQSPFFENSTKYQCLLRYLVKNTLENKYVKEATIAIDVFHKGSDFDPTFDSSVRVSIGKLRDKLNQYYLSEGNTSHLKFEIPRGHYRIKFIPVDKPGMISWIHSVRLPYVILTLLILFLLLINFLQWQNKQHILSIPAAIPKNDPVWKEFLSNDLPVTIVTGDLFFMYKQNDYDRRKLIIRDPIINSIDDLLKFKNREPDLYKSYDNLWMTYTPANMSQCIRNLLPVFQSRFNQTRILPASRLTWEDINNNNILFIGNFKSLHLLNQLCPKYWLQFNLTQRTYSILDKNKKAIKTFSPDSTIDGTKDISTIVIKRPGANHNVVMFILSFNRIGLTEITKKISHLEFLNIFKQHYLSEASIDPLFFDLVFSVEGIGNAPYKSKIIYFKTNDYDKNN